MKFIDFLIETSATHNPFEEIPPHPDDTPGPNWLYSAPKKSYGQDTDALDLSDEKTYTQKINRILRPVEHNIKWFADRCRILEQKIPHMDPGARSFNWYLDGSALQPYQNGIDHLNDREQSEKYWPFTNVNGTAQYPNLLRQIIPLMHYWREKIGPAMKEASVLASEIRQHMDAERNAKSAAEQARKEAAKASVGPAVKKGDRAAVIRAGNTIPPNQVPKVIIQGRSKLTNPYWNAVDGQYAGDINKYPFSTQSQTAIQMINTLLRNNNVPELKTLYAGNRSAGSLLNCIGLGGKNDSIVWYKYDAGGGTGQNYVYVCGNKIQTTRLDDAFIKKHYKP